MKKTLFRKTATSNYDELARNFNTAISPAGEPAEQGMRDSAPRASAGQRALRYGTGGALLGATAGSGLRAGGLGVALGAGAGAGLGGLVGLISAIRHNKNITQVPYSEYSDEQLDDQLARYYGFRDQYGDDLTDALHQIQHSADDEGVTGERLRQHLQGTAHDPFGKQAMDAQWAKFEKVAFMR